MRRAARRAVPTLLVLLIGAGAGLAVAAPAAAAVEELRIAGGPLSADGPGGGVAGRPPLPARHALPHRPSSWPTASAAARTPSPRRRSCSPTAASSWLAYTARGFGASTGLISMNSPEFEVADASRVVDYLASRPEVELDADGDPRVGFAGGSYGGALALLAAGYDERVDAVAADITWNDLQASLFGQSARASTGSPGTAVGDGVYKQLWSGLFFSAGLTSVDGQVTTCGRFSPDWCARLHAGRDRRHGLPRGRRAHAPVLPGEHRRSHRRAHPARRRPGRLALPARPGRRHRRADRARPTPDTPLKVVWHAAGHDGGVDETRTAAGAHRGLVRRAPRRRSPGADRLRALPRRGVGAERPGQRHGADPHGPDVPGPVR